MQKIKIIAHFGHAWPRPPKIWQLAAALRTFNVQKIKTLAQPITEIFTICHFHTLWV